SKVYKSQDENRAALQKVANFKVIDEKKRLDTKGKYIEGDDFVAGERGEFPRIVKENGVNFSVYLNDGAMVGVFLDQRNVRKQIRDKYAKGRTVLNMFSYTGAFSVFAALGGASKTTSVALASRSLSKTIEQVSVDDVEYEAQDIIVEDVFL
ncbi:class I SAM-dependent methyltransferase, partial [Bacillus sp. S1-R5C1-FB]|uniref:class I SAM-dependent methyltransferase n=1 Tax=Bacillus sp. S1-R5C1-FB TaxID=1973491 RepID=UPI0015C51BBE